MFIVKCQLWFLVFLPFNASADSLILKYIQFFFLELYLKYIQFCKHICSRAEGVPAHYGKHALTCCLVSIFSPKHIWDYVEGTGGMLKKFFMVLTFYSCGYQEHSGVFVQCIVRVWMHARFHFPAVSNNIYKCWQMAYFRSGFWTEKRNGAATYFCDCVPWILKFTNTNFGFQKMQRRTGNEIIPLFSPYLLTEVNLRLSSVCWVEMENWAHFGHQ